jgi:hypothetical protein
VGTFLSPLLFDGFRGEPRSEMDNYAFEMRVHLRGGLLLVVHLFVEVVLKDPGLRRNGLQSDDMNAYLTKVVDPS